MSLFRQFTAVALTAGLALPAVNAAAQRPRTTRITFDDAVGIALKQNLSVRQAENTASLGQASVTQQKMQMLPDLRLSVNGSNNVGRNFSQSDGAIINQQTQALSTGLSSSFTLFDGGKTAAAIHSAEANEQASSADLSRTKQTAVFTVAQNYVALSNQQEQLGVQQENLTAQQAQLELIQKLVDAGSRPVSDLYQQQAAVANAKLLVAQASHAVELAKVDLIQTLQLDPAGTYDFVAPKVSEISLARTPNLDSLVALAYENRADLDADQARVDAAGQDVKAAKAAKLPTIGLTGAYSTAYSSASDLSLSNQLDQRRGGSVGVGISIPIFDRGSANVAEQRAQIEQENARLALDAQKQSVALDVRRAYLDQQSAVEQLAAAKAQLTAATQAVEMTTKRYQAGAATLVEVTQAQAQRVQAASAVATAENNLVLQQTVMSYYTGSLDPKNVHLGE